MKGNGTATYVAMVLALASALAQLDRQVMGLLTEPVKADLGLNDLQVSLLQGLAFVLMQSLMAVPMGFLIDRRSRRVLLALGIAFWSLATAACGLAGTFAQLFLARFAVGIGEATLMPATQSLLPDYFPPSRLARGFTIFQMGAYLGNGGAFALGGLILSAASAWDPIRLPVMGTLAPWQLTFLLVAAPGPLVAMLMLTVREPARRPNPAFRAVAGTAASFSGFARSARPFLLAHLGTVACSGIVVFGLVAWTPSFFVRSFGWSPARIGIAYGMIAMLSGVLGTVASAFAERAFARRRGRDGAVQANLLALGVGMPAAFLYPLCPTPLLALACLAVFNFCIGISSTLMPVILQLATPPAFRGRIGAVYVFAASAVGASLGPVAVAALTDLVLRDPARLWLSLAIVAGAVGGATVVLGLFIGRTFTGIAAAET